MFSKGIFDMGWISNKSIININDELSWLAETFGLEISFVAYEEKEKDNSNIIGYALLILFLHGVYIWTTG
jgi:hypothetical protein